MQGDTVKVEVVMQRDPFFIDGLANVAEALALMRQNAVSSLVIEKRHAGDEYGFLTVNEIATKVLALSRPLERTAVYEVMEKPVLTIAPGMQVKYAVRLLAQLGRRRALVENDSGILGFVSLRDLVLSYGAPERGAERGAESGAESAAKSEAKNAAGGAAEGETGTPPE